jgi:acetyl esterase/lipase
MTSKLLTIFVACVFPACALAASPSSPTPSIAPQVEQAAPYPAQDVTFPQGVRGKPGLIYWEPAGYRPLQRDLYLPPETLQRPAQGFPLIVYIHGGWMEGDRHRSGAFTDFPSVLATLAARGYVVASIDYRLIGKAPEQTREANLKALDATFAFFDKTLKPTR